MKDFCNCSAWKDLREKGATIIKWDPTYGWVLNWIELTEEKGYTQVHRYGITIEFCPMCGRSLKISKD
jgi:hypothetical protein